MAQTYWEQSGEPNYKSIKGAWFKEYLYDFKYLLCVYVYNIVSFSFHAPLNYASQI